MTTDGKKPPAEAPQWAKNTGWIISLAFFAGLGFIILYSLADKAGII